MTVQTPQTTVTTSAVIVNLGATDSVIVKKHVLLSTSGNPTIYGTGSNQSVAVEGYVHSTYIGIDLDSTSAIGSSITVAESGTVFANFAAILAYGTKASVTVDGLVHGGTYGIGFIGTSSDTFSKLVNTGTIEANQAVFRDGAHTTETIKVVNSGVIEGTTFCYGVLNAGHDAKDLITNTGKMIGDIRLDGGDDVYNGAKGSVEGSVFGGLGDDVITGGKEDNLLFGDEGLDKLTGGLGADQLTGGADLDVFIYKSVKESTVNPAGRDTIKDFSQIDADQINLKAIDANTKQAGDQKFIFIDDAAFHGKAGELRYAFVSGQTLVQGDLNGDKKADFAILLDGEITLGAGDFIL